MEQWDRNALERLARYCARPTFAEGRLCLAEPDTVVYTLTKPDPWGRSTLILTPLELIDRLSSLIPPPRVHRHRYAGVLAPNSRLRSQVVSSAGPAGALAESLTEAAQKMDLHTHAGADQQVRDSEPVFPSRASRLCWAMLLARIHDVLPLLCPRCSCPMQVVGFITQPEVIVSILSHLGEPVELPPVAPARDVQLRLLTTTSNRGPPFHPS